MTSPSQPSRNSSDLRLWVEVAVAVVFRRRGGAVELLVARRHADAVRGGLWEFPGGKIEPGEAAQEAALREVEEEVGLKADQLAGPPLALAISADSDPTEVREKSVRLHAFLVEVHADAVASALASKEVRWIAVADLNRLEWPRANAAINEAIRHWHAASGMDGGARAGFD